MKKVFTAIVTIAIISTFIFAGFYFISNRDNTTVTQPVSGQEVTDSEPIKFSEDGKSLTYVGQEGVSALETLRLLTEIETNKFEAGEFVVSINGVKADQSKEYWSLFINDQYAEVGAGDYIAKERDIFKWQMENIR